MKRVFRPMMTLIIVRSWALIKQLAVIQGPVSGCVSFDLSKIANKGKYYWPELSHNRGTMRRQTRLDHEERMEAAIPNIVEHTAYTISITTTWRPPPPPS